MVLEQILAPVPGGTGRYSIEMASHLAAGASADSSVTGWVAWHRDVAAARLPRVLGPRRFLLGRRPLALAWQYGHGPRPSGADVVHAPTLLIPPPGSYRLVVTIHDAVPWTHPETLTPRGVQWHRAMAERAAAVAAEIVVPTAAVAVELGRVVPLRRPPVVVPLGVSGRLGTPPDVEERARSLQLPDGPFLLSLATLEPRKGLDLLLEALARPEAPDVPVLLAGQAGWGGVDPVRMASAAGLPEGRLRLLGRISDADLATVLDRATVLVAPSRAEGFGLPVLEAMAAGTPVVTSDAPALVEVGGGATRVTPVGDTAALAEALAEVVTDAALHQHLRTAGLRRAAEFSWSASAQRLWSIYGGL